MPIFLQESTLFNLGIHNNYIRLADEIGRFEEVLKNMHPECEIRDITRVPLK